LLPYRPNSISSPRYEGGLVGDARLLHVVGDDRDRAILGQFSINSSTLGESDRVERRARLVEQDHLGAHRATVRAMQRRCLAAGERRPEAFSLSLTSFHSAAAQRFSDPAVHFGTWRSSHKRRILNAMFS
jgi:hypothetical protein